MKARDNPFRAERVLSVRFRLDALEPDLTWEELFSRLETLKWRGALVGPEGSGKTTLLEDLEEQIVARGWQTQRLRLSREEPHFAPGFLAQFYATLTSQDVILFDGAEQLSRFAWHNFKRYSQSAKGLIITSHRAAMLPTLAHCRTSPQLLRDILDELLGEDAAQWHGEVATLWQRHDGNLRHALRELYDVYADLKVGDENKN
jgi:hypothetical protein